MNKTEDYGVMEWFNKVKHSDRSYKFSVPGYKVYFVTGLFYEDEEVIQFDTPIKLEDQKSIVVYMTKVDLKSGFKVFDSIEEFIGMRGKGKLKLNIVKAMSAKNTDAIYKTYTKIASSLFSYVINSTISPDDLDKKFIKNIIELHYIRRTHGSVIKEDLLDKDMFIDSPNLVEPVIKLLNESSSLPELMVKFFRIVEVSKRISSLDEEMITITLLTALPRDLANYVLESLNDLTILIPLSLEVYSNVFYKKSKMNTFFVSNSSFLDIKEVIKDTNTFLDI